MTLSIPSHKRLKDRLEDGELEPYLRHIRFPSYKNLEQGLRIDFLHPITAIVGPNGTNKTSILRAIEGCQAGVSLGRYWFGTDLDFIDQSSRPRVIHGWNPASVGYTVEALKQRVPKKNDSDYWEPAQAARGLGMAPMVDGEGQLNLPGRKLDGERSRDRWNPIPKEMVYLDFRAMLSAFDKYFFHQPEIRTPGKGSDGARRRGTVRRNAVHIRESIESGRVAHQHNRRNRVLRAGRSLEPSQLQAVSGILGRKYSEIRVLEHEYYGVPGYTALMTTDVGRYSEAFAGAGEFAVIMLVIEIFAAKNGSLILLDEPETSLHPGAQKHLVEFLQTRCAAQRLQFVLATHSPTMIEGLPDEAIKVLELNPSGRVSLRSQASSPDSAFVALGELRSPKTIIVEDRLAREIVLQALRSHGSIGEETFDVCVLPGGADAIARHVVGFVKLGWKPLVMLDGDQRRSPPKPDEDLSESEVESEVRRVCRSAWDVINQMKKTDAESHGAEAENWLARQFLVWWREQVSFLPGEAPDHWLMENDPRLNQDVSEDVVAATRSNPSASNIGKEYWRRVTELELPAGRIDSRQILDEQRRAIRRISDASPELFDAIARSIPTVGGT